MKTLRTDRIILLISCIFVCCLANGQTSSKINVIYNDDYYNESDTIQLSCINKNIQLCSYSLNESPSAIFHNIQHLLKDKITDYIFSISTKNDTTQIYAIGDYFWNIFEYDKNIIGACHIITENRSKNIIISCDDKINSRKVLSEIFKRKGDSLNYVRKVKLLPDSVYIIKHYTPTGFVTIFKNDTILVNKIYN